MNAIFIIQLLLLVINRVLKNTQREIESSRVNVSVINSYNNYELHESTVMIIKFLCSHH